MFNNLVSVLVCGNKWIQVGMYKAKERLLQELFLPRTISGLINRKRKYDPISDDLTELHWLPVEQRIDLKILVLTYKAIHHQSRDYISSMLQVRTDSRHLRSTSFAPQLVQPRTHHITFANRAFSCYVPRKWNQLPPQIRNANSISIFKRLLKSHLFELAYGQ